MHTPVDGQQLNAAIAAGENMGHFCRIYKRSRPNEKFSGKGHRIHVCKVCAEMPEKERAAIEQEDEIFGFLKQSRISDRNIRRLQYHGVLGTEQIERLSPETQERLEALKSLNNLRYPISESDVRLLIQTCSILIFLFKFHRLEQWITG